MARHPDETHHHGAPKSSADDLAEELARRQRQILEIERQKEQLERQRKLLEELAQKQDEVRDGQKEMTEKLQRAAVILEREEEDSARMVEQLAFTRKVFVETLGVVAAIDPDSWDKDEMPDALTHALAQLDQARAIYNQHTLKLQALKGDSASHESPDNRFRGGPEDGPGGGFSFGEWFQRGCAFHAPLVIVFLAFLVVFILKK